MADTCVELYSDGAAHDNPGKGGYGTILRFTRSNDEVVERELSQGFRYTTNNRMELMGIIAGFDALKRPCQVQVYSDSQYVVQAFNDHWIDSWIKRGWKNAAKKPVKNKDLWQRLCDEVNKHEVSFHWVRGHNGHPENERCDQLAREASDSDYMMQDSVFEKEQNFNQPELLH